MIVYRQKGGSETGQKPGLKFGGSLCHPSFPPLPKMVQARCPLSGAMAQRMAYLPGRVIKEDYSFFLSDLLKGLFSSWMGLLLSLESEPLNRNADILFEKKFFSKEMLRPT